MTIWSGLPEGLDAKLLAEEQLCRPGRKLIILPDGARAERMADQLGFFAPSQLVQYFPAWDCLPYDRVSPAPDIASRRLSVLERLSRDEGEPLILVTTTNAYSQKVVPRSFVRDHTVRLLAGREIHVDRLLRWLAHQGYLRTGTVRESGEFAVRGGIIDIFPTGRLAPVRLDLFGSQIESVSRFDPDAS
jgi:Transcription-repair coupling factor (superfamily II helicase)